jgi:hypothetical protein
MFKFFHHSALIENILEMPFIKYFQSNNFFTYCVFSKLDLAICASLHVFDDQIPVVYAKGFLRRGFRGWSRWFG